MADVTGTLRFTANSKHSARFLAYEDLSHSLALSRVTDIYPDAVEFDTNEEVWFYEDEAAEARDEDNKDYNRGVIAVWRPKPSTCEVCGDDLNSDGSCPGDPHCRYCNDRRYDEDNEPCSGCNPDYPSPKQREEERGEYLYEQQRDRQIEREWEEARANG